MTVIKSNFHTHTKYCDGINTPREMVESAIALGFTSLGFSGHIGGDAALASYSMSESALKAYLSEISELKGEYADRIKIFCGAELDRYSLVDTSLFDYTIGSAHLIKKDGADLHIDESAETERQNVDLYYGGDFDAYCEEYYSTVIECVKRFSPTVIGHLDLPMKYMDINGRVETARYLDIAHSAIAELCKFGIPFEINTGAISKKYRTTPYPSEALLGMIRSEGGSVMINSDCHNAEHLDCAYDTAEAFAKRCGFEEHCVLTDSGLEFIKF